MRDGKNKFYRYLNLSKEEKDILKWFRVTKKELMDDKFSRRDREKDQ